MPRRASFEAGPPSPDGAISAATVKAAEAVHSALREAGVDAVLYHGKLGGGTCDNCVRISAAFAAAEREREADAEPAVDAAATLPERGKIVSVPRYGRGMVDSVDAEGVAVVFAEGSRRTFLPAFVRRESAPAKRLSRPAKVTASAA